MNAFEASLSILSPIRSTLNRDAIMFRAGQQSVGRRWTWPSATAALALISLGEAALLTSRPAPEPRIIERVVEVPTRDSAPPVVAPEQNRGVNVQTSNLPLNLPETGSLARQDYYHLREQALRFGVDNLPGPLSSGEDPEKSAEAFRTEIRSMLDPGGTL